MPALAPKALSVRGGLQLGWLQLLMQVWGKAAAGVIVTVACACVWQLGWLEVFGMTACPALNVGLAAPGICSSAELLEPEMLLFLCSLVQVGLT